MPIFLSQEDSDPIPSMPSPPRASLESPDPANNSDVWEEESTPANAMAPDPPRIPAANFPIDMCGVRLHPGSISAVKEDVLFP